MNRLAIVAVTLALLTPAAASADQLVSGPQAGDRVSASFEFTGLKCGGATDRFSVGTKLSYF